MTTKRGHFVKLWLDLFGYWIWRQVWRKLWSLLKLEITLHKLLPQNWWRQCDWSWSLYVGWTCQSVQCWDKGMDQIECNGWKAVVQHCSSRNRTQKHRHEITSSKLKNEKQRIQGFTCYSGTMWKGYVNLLLIIYLWMLLLFKF